MAKKSVLYMIFSDLVNTLKGVIDKKLIFLQDRPNVGEKDTPMSKFAVIDLPIEISDYVIGNKKTYLTTSGVFYLFTAATKQNTLDANATGDFLDSVLSLFPINASCCTATNPVIRLRGSDGMGYQVTTITFDLLCKWRAFE